MARIKINLSDWKKLKMEIESRLNIVGQSTNYKTTKITSCPGVKVSIPNLNKFWDKDIDDPVSMNEDTINDLISILGYKNWEEYKRHLDLKILQGYESMRIYYPVDIDISNMENQIVTLGWEDKYSKIKVIDGYECEVIESHNMYKVAGERFVTLGFSLKENPPGLPHIMLDDFGDGYFEYLEKDSGIKFDDEYFYL